MKGAEHQKEERERRQARWRAPGNRRTNNLETTERKENGVYKKNIRTSWNRRRRKKNNKKEGGRTGERQRMAEAVAQYMRLNELIISKARVLKRRGKKRRKEEIKDVATQEKKTVKQLLKGGFISVNACQEEMDRFPPPLWLKGYIYIYICLLVSGSESLMFIQRTSSRDFGLVRCRFSRYCCSCSAAACVVYVSRSSCSLSLSRSAVLLLYSYSFLCLAFYPRRTSLSVNLPTLRDVVAAVAACYRSALYHSGVDRLMQCTMCRLIARFHFFLLYTHFFFTYRICIYIYIYMTFLFFYNSSTTYGFC